MLNYVLVAAAVFSGACPVRAPLAHAACMLLVLREQLLGAGAATDGAGLLTHITCCTGWHPARRQRCRSLPPPLHSITRPPTRAYPAGMAGAPGGDSGALAQWVSNASFATLMLIYSFTELLDLSKHLSNMAGEESVRWVDRIPGIPAGAAQGLRVHRAGCLGARAWRRAAHPHAAWQPQCAHFLSTGGQPKVWLVAARASSGAERCRWHGSAWALHNACTEHAGTHPLGASPAPLTSHSHTHCAACRVDSSRRADAGGTGPSARCRPGVQHGRGLGTGRHYLWRRPNQPCVPTACAALTEAAAGRRRQPVAGGAAGAAGAAVGSVAAAGRGGGAEGQQWSIPAGGVV